MMTPVQFRILKEKNIAYTGKELRPHWCLSQTGVYGSIITAFVGACDVPTEHLVDWEDRLNNDHIRAEKMLHMIGEFFNTTLEAGVLYQRLLMVWAEKLLREKGFPNITRQGDDLFISNQKLSVSIATVSPVSVLVHWGININPQGAPVPAIGLEKLGWSGFEALAFAEKLLTHYIEEIQEIAIAQAKVRPV